MACTKKKKERRHKRYIKNVESEIHYKESAWENGKLIEENHNGNRYSSEYTINLSERLICILDDIFYKSKGSNEIYINEFRKYKNKLIDLILLWSPMVDRDQNYNYFKLLLETYWDNINSLIIIASLRYDK